MGSSTGKKKTTSTKESKRKRNNSVSSVSTDDSIDDSTNSSSSISEEEDEEESSSSSSSDEEDDDLPPQTKQFQTGHKNASDSLKSLQSQLTGYVSTNLDLVLSQTTDTQQMDSEIKTKFKQIYMDYVTSGFGTDLDELRKQGDIDGSENFSMLVDALETGIQSFTAADQKMIVDESS